MSDVEDTTLYTIGELARRTGLGVKTIRFYSDTGVVPPTERTPAGYRLYDVWSISRLELVRTLRELGAGLDEIRSVLSHETTLPRVAAKHLEVLEEQFRLLRVRRAVLRAVVRQQEIGAEGTGEEVRLLHKLANMSDEQRERLIDEFWDEITSGLNLDPGFENWIRSAKPNLPDDPSSEQVEAWIELAELVQDVDFREVVRRLYRTQADRRDSGEDTGPQTPESAQWWLALMSEARECYDAGVEPDSAQGAALADRIAAGFAARLSHSDERQLREEMAERFEEEYDRRVERYWELIYTINGWSGRRMLGPAASWLAEALRAPLR